MKKTTLFTLALLALTACQQNEAQSTDESNKIEISKTPALKACSKEARMCPDGSTVGRNPQKSCEFDACSKNNTKPISKPYAKMCTADVKECPDGSYVGRDHYNNCKFKDCPTSKKSSE